MYRSGEITNSFRDDREKLRKKPMKFPVKSVIFDFKIFMCIDFVIKNIFD